MAKKYVIVRIPKETYDNFKVKKVRMEADLQRMTGKKIALPMTRVFALVAKNPVEIEFQKLARETKGKVRFDDDFI